MNIKLWIPFLINSSCGLETPIHFPAVSLITRTNTIQQDSLDNCFKFQDKVISFKSSWLKFIDSYNVNIIFGFTYWGRVLFLPWVKNKINIKSWLTPKTKSCAKIFLKLKSKFNFHTILINMHFLLIFCICTLLLWGDILITFKLPAHQQLP